MDSSRFAPIAAKQAGSSPAPGTNLPLRRGEAIVQRLWPNSLDPTPRGGVDCRMRSKAIEGLARFTSQFGSTDVGEGLRELVSGIDDDTQGLVGALNGFALGEWQFAATSDEYAREIIGRCSAAAKATFGGEKLLEFDHYVALGEVPRFSYLIVGWKEERRPLPTLYVVSPQDDIIDYVGSPKDWVEKVCAGVFQGIDWRQAEPLRDALGIAHWPAFARFPEATARMTALEAEIEGAEALVAGGHLTFALAENGGVVSVHKKGIRFINSQGKRKPSNAPKRIYTGGISPDGTLGWYSHGGTKSEEQGALCLVPLPDGKPVTKVPLPNGADDGVSAVLLSPDRVVLRGQDSLTLCSLDGDSLVKLHEVSSPALGPRLYRMIPLFRGRGLLADAPFQQWELYLVDGDELKLARRFKRPSGGQLNEVKINDRGDETHIALRSVAASFKLEDVKRVSFEVAPSSLEPQPIPLDPAVQAKSLETAWARPMPNGMFFALLAEGAGYTPALVGVEGIQPLGLGVQPSWYFGWSPSGEWLYLGRGKVPVMVNSGTLDVVELPEQPGDVMAIARARGVVLVHHETVDGFAVAAYRQDDDGAWSALHRTTSPELHRLLASEEHDVAVAVLMPGAEMPGCLIHVGDDGLRVLGCTKLRPQAIWGDGGVLRWMSRREDLDSVVGLTTDGHEGHIRVHRGLLVRPFAMDLAIAHALDQPADSDLAAVDRHAHHADALNAVSQHLGDEIAMKSPAAGPTAAYFGPAR